jgi:NAD(P)-dependent dehydrogenase (short-subunit alcohol dehydrogenase family)
MTAMRTHFLTTRAAARHMVKSGSGVILAFGGDGPQTLPGLGGFKVALDAIEGLRRQWAVELGPHGIRVVTLKTGGVPESIPDNFAGKDEIAASIQGYVVTGATGGVSNVAAFIAQIETDRGRHEVNISCGAIMD